MESLPKRRKLPFSSYFSILPDEIATHIFNYLDIISKLCLRRVSRKWNLLLQDTFETVKIDERWCKTNIQERNCMTSTTANAHLMIHLPTSLWKGVKCIIIDGDYDLTNETPHAGEHPIPESRLFQFVIHMINSAKFHRLERFQMLDTIVLKGVAVVLGKLDFLIDRLGLRCRFVLCESTVVVDLPTRIGTSDPPCSIEFAAMSLVFNLRGVAEVGYLENPPDLHTQHNAFSDFKLRVKRVIRDFIVNQCNAAIEGDLSRLEDLYSTLLRGREGMTIRKELPLLFKRIFEQDAVGNPREGYDPSRKHWEQCTGYDFNGLDRISKFALVYYANPRNCFRLAPRAAGSPQEPKEL